MKELVKPNHVEEEFEELNFYCETRNSCSCGIASNNRNSSLDIDDEIIF